MSKSCIGALVLAAACLAGCRETPEYRQASGAAWGTAYHITYRSTADLSDSIVAEMRRVELSLSMFDPTSCISRINSGESRRADSAIAQVWAVAERVHRASGGAFDPTVAPLVDLWGFGRQGRSTEIPDQQAIDSALAVVGFGRCSLAQDGTVTRPSDKMSFDFSAIAKGYGVDRVAQMLRRCGCTDYLVEIGGEMSLAGHNPTGQPWRIQIDSPEAATPGADALTMLDTTDCAIATSGNYRNYRTDSAGTRYGHTVDPRTGRPMPGQWASVSVIAPDCTLADALATALMAAPRDSARAILHHFPDVKAIMVP